jgi:hypothetical protein
LVINLLDTKCTGIQKLFFLTRLRQLNSWSWMVDFLITHHWYFFTESLDTKKEYWIKNSWRSSLLSSNIDDPWLNILLLFRFGRRLTYIGNCALISLLHIICNKITIWFNHLDTGRKLKLSQWYLHHGTFLLNHLSILNWYIHYTLNLQNRGLNSFINIIKIFIFM